MWYSRYGNFRPGVRGYPHQGDVYAWYRKKRGFRTQMDLAIALGYKSAGPVEEMESNMNIDMPDSVERRMILAKLLRIPPALLALDWRFMASQNGEEGENPLADIAHLMEEDTYNLYNTILALGWEATFKGVSPELTRRIDVLLKKLEGLVELIPLSERDLWLELLCRYYQLSTRCAQRRKETKRAFKEAQLAVDVAIKLEDPELKTLAYFWRSRLFLEQEKWEEARSDALISLDFLEKAPERLRDPLKGNIYLLAAEVNAPYSGNDAQLRDRCKQWQDKAASIVYRGKLEDDTTFVKLNTATLHHERAKILMQLHRAKYPDEGKRANGQSSEWLKEAQKELTTAWKVLSPDLLIWHVNFQITEARLYQTANDLERSAISGLEAYNLASVLNARDKETQVLGLYHQLTRHDDANPHVCNLGRCLGVF